MLHFQARRLFVSVTYTHCQKLLFDEPLIDGPPEDGQRCFERSGRLRNRGPVSVSPPSTWQY